MASTSGRRVVVPLTNKSGGGVINGDVVIVNSANDTSFTTTTTAAYTAGLVGVAQETIANDAVGRVAFAGYVGLVTVDASVTRGQFGKTHTAAKQATGASARAAGTFCQWVTGGTTPTAILFGVPDEGGGSGAANGLSLAPDSDTHIDGSSRSPTTNYTSSATLGVGDTTATWGRVALLTFDLATVPDTILGAFLRLVRSDVNNSINGVQAILCRKMLRAYVTAEATGNIYSTGNNWTTALAEGTTDRSVSVYGRGVFPRTGTPVASEEQIVTFDLTAMLQQAMDATETHLRLHLRLDAAANGNNTVDFHSLESATANKRPRLDIVGF